jgi:hypothetical protein
MLTTLKIYGNKSAFISEPDWNSLKPENVPATWYFVLMNCQDMPINSTKEKRKDKKGKGKK